MVTQASLAPAEAHCAQIIPFPRKARRKLSDDEEALIQRLQDAQAGMAWWNSLPPPERLRWLNLAGSASPADAWKAFKAGVAS